MHLSQHHHQKEHLRNKWQCTAEKLSDGAETVLLKYNSSIPKKLSLPYQKIHLRNNLQLGKKEFRTIRFKVVIAKLFFL